MRRGTLAAFLGGVVMLSVGAPALASALADDGPSASPPAASTSSPSSPSAAPRATPDADAPDDTSARDRAGGGRRGHGPPAWAQTHGKVGVGGGGGKERGPHAAWKHRTPRQQVTTMATLTRSHAAGMRTWARCTAAGRGDCVRPLPPGLAKRR